MARMSKLCLLVMVVVAAMAAVEVSGQSQPPACASKLIGCQAFLNSTSPPNSCCSPLREAVQNELPCLCSLFNDRDLFKAFNINITQALELPKHCGITQGVSNCNTTAPAPTAGAPPGTPGGDSDAGRVAGAGLSTVTGLLLLWASVV